MKNIKSSDRKYLKVFILAVCVLIAYKILFNFSSLVGGISQVLSILSPFITGFIIAYFINIPCAWIEKLFLKIKAKPFQKAARLLSILLCVILIITLGIFGVSNLVPMVYESLSQLFMSLPEFLELTLEFIGGIPLVVTLGLDVWIDGLMEPDTVNGLFSDLNLSPVSSSIQLASSLFTGIFNFVLTIVSTIYFLIEYKSIKAYIKRLIGLIPNTDKRRSTLKYIHITDKSFRQFITCQILDCLILGTAATIALFILRSPYALVLGMMLGIVNIVPYFGAIIGSVVTVIIMFFTNGFETALLSAMILLIIQQVDGNFINPKIMGKSFKVSPVLIIIAITVGGAIGGAFGGISGTIAGMIFAIPIVNVFKILLEEYMQEKDARTQA
ncbi:MAG: AI-2E family transporter [Oscillospiraceae bacterium]|nr:AI-2E family transporter [Oscillospiraceae bacterium]